MVVSENEQLIVIESRQYGRMEVHNEQLYRFERGIVGFPEQQQFALVGVEDSAFYTLHSLDGSVCFHLIAASIVVKDYQFTINDNTVGLLGAKSPEDIVVFLIVNAIEEQLFVNLKAPVLIVPSTQTGLQYIISDEDYPIRHPLNIEERS